MMNDTTNDTRFRIKSKLVMICSNMRWKPAGGRLDQVADEIAADPETSQILLACDPNDENFLRALQYRIDAPKRRAAARARKIRRENVVRWCSENNQPLLAALLSC
jgi:hypothetical protein